MLQTCGKTSEGYQEAKQYSLTLPSELVSLTTREVKQAKNWLPLKCFKEKADSSSFPLQLDSRLLSAITPSPLQAASGPLPPCSGLTLCCNKLGCQHVTLTSKE